MNGTTRLFVFWTDFLQWLLVKTGKFPRSVRFTLSSRIDNLALDILEDVIVAQYDRQRLEPLRRVSINIDKLRVLLRICHSLGHLDNRGYEYASRHLDEAGRMTGGWMKHAAGQG